MPVVFLLLLGDSPASEFYIPTFFPAYTTYEDGTECSETSAYKIQTPGIHQRGRIRRLEHGESLKSRIITVNENNIWPVREH
jgi:hypothetical protein